MGSTYTLEVSGGISTQEAMAAWDDDVPLLDQAVAKQPVDSKISLSAGFQDEAARSLKSVTPFTTSNDFSCQCEMVALPPL